MPVDRLDAKYAAAKAALADLDSELVSSITASGAPSRAARMAATHRPQPSPNQQVTGTPAPLIAAAAAAGVNPGDVLADKTTLARVMVDTLQGAQRSDPPIGPRIVARRRWSDAYPEERRLSLNDAEGNTRKITAVCGPEAIVASGGVCLPVNVDYSLPTWASADRPLRDNLPAFQADRGGLRFVTPPDIGVPSLQATASGLGAATGIWTEATDANPAGQTKPVYAVACGAEQLVYVNAVPTRVGFGNMQGRFAPEQVAANTDLAIAVAAREAELELLTLMYGSAKPVAPVQYLGAGRDLIACVDLLIEQYRYSHRIPETVGFTAVLPAWAKGLIRSDIVREVAHDNAGAINAWSITNAQIEEWLSDRGVVNVIWTVDGLRSGTYNAGVVLNQFFGIPTANAKPQWPNQATDGTVQVAWLLYPEGTYQFLDGGRLDLGVVRDSTLDATNDYETFIEVFESVAFRGIEAYMVLSVVQPDGASAGTVAVTGYHE
jgi:hypothetical protein